MPAAERSIPVTAPLLATRDALASALSAVYVDHPMWTHKGAVWTCRCGASLGRFNDPVTSKPIEPLPLWHAHVAEVQAGALAGVVRDPATLADDDAAQKWASVAFALARDVNRMKQVCNQEHPPKMGSPTRDWPPGTETRHSDGTCCVLLEDGDYALRAIATALESR